MGFISGMAGVEFSFSAVYPVGTTELIRANTGGNNRRILILSYQCLKRSATSGGLEFTDPLNEIWDVADGDQTYSNCYIQSDKNAGLQVRLVGNVAKISVSGIFVGA